MATPIKQIQTSDNTLHDIMAGEYIIGTQSAATNMWEGVSESDSLYAGKVINYKLPIAGATNTNTHTGLTTNTTLELTLADGSTVVNPVYRNASSAITTHYPANSVIRLIFDPTSVTLGGYTFAGSWKTADYDANTNTYVAQSNTTTNGYLPLILKATTATATVTTTVRFNSNLTGNPSTGDIKLKSTTIKPTATTANTVNLPTGSGTLALTSDIPTTLPPTAHTHSIGEVYNGTSALSVNSTASNVKMDGTASAGSGSALALANHVHPTDTSRAPLASPAFTGTPTAPTPTTTLGIANKGYVDSALGGITQVDYSVTTTLPTTGVKGTIYLVAHEHDASQNDYYDEYIYANSGWEKIGHTDIDLTDYATKSFVTTTLVNDGLKIIDLGEQTIPTSGYTVMSGISDIITEIANNYQNKNLALRVHDSTNNRHTICFNVGTILFNGMTFYGFQGSLVQIEDGNPTVYEIYIGIGYGESSGVNLIGAVKQLDIATLEDTGMFSGYTNLTSSTNTLSIGELVRYNGSREYVEIPTDLSNYVNDVGYITGITSTDVTTALGYTPSAEGHTHDYSKVAFTQTNTSGDEIGKITIDGVTTTLYADSNTDTQVSQVLTSTNANYPIIFAYDTNTTTTATRTNTVRRDNDFYYNPSTNHLTVNKITATSGTITSLTSTTANITTANISTANITTINGVTVGSSPKFTDTTYTAASFTATYDSRYALAGHTHDYSSVSVDVPSMMIGTTVATITVTDNGTTHSYILRAPAYSQEQADWEETDTGAFSYIKNKPEFADVAYSGSVEDLIDWPESLLYDDSISTSSVNVVSSYSPQSSNLDVTTVYPAANVDAITSVSLARSSIYPAANVIALTTVVPSYTNVYPAADVNAVTAVNKSTTTVYGTGTTTVYGTGTITNVMSAPTVVNGVLSFTTVTVSNGVARTVSNGTSVTVLSDVTTTSSNVRGTEVQTVGDVSVLRGASVRGEAVEVGTALSTSSASVRDTATSVATGSASSSGSGTSVLTDLGTPQTESVVSGVTANGIPV